MPATAERPTISVDFSKPEINSNPWPVLKEIRELAPVVYNPVTEWWMTTSYRGVMKVLTNEERFAPDHDLMKQLFGAVPIEGMDNPKHDEVREVWQEHLLRGGVAEWEDQIDQVIADEVDPVVEAMQRGETVDVAEGFCRSIPSLAVAQLLGLPKEDFPKFGSLARGIGAILDARGDDSPRSQELTQLGAESIQKMGVYVDEVMQQRRSEGSTDDLIGMMANADISISDAERNATIVQLIFGGQDTTSKLMSQALALLWENPDQREAMRNDRALVVPAIEEVLRFGSPVFSNWRVVRGGDFDFKGITLAEGSRVINLHGGANHDPSRWEDPDRFDITREPRQHSTFGFGSHSCIGLNLARMEARLWMEQMLDKVPEWQIATDSVDYGHNFTVRGPVEIPLCLN